MGPCHFIPRLGFSALQLQDKILIPFLFSKVSSELNLPLQIFKSFKTRDNTNLCHKSFTPFMQYQAVLSIHKAEEPRVKVKEDSRGSADQSHDHPLGADKVTVSANGNQGYRAARRFVG